MKPNADCTVFLNSYDPNTRKNTWSRLRIYGVYWQGVVGTSATMNSSGVREDNETVIFIPLGEFPIEISPEDKIIRGIREEESPVGLPGALTVMGVETFDYGSRNMRHLEVVAK